MLRLVSAASRTFFALVLACQPALAAVARAPSLRPAGPGLGWSTPAGSISSPRLESGLSPSAVPSAGPSFQLVGPAGAPLIQEAAPISPAVRPEVLSEGAAGQRARALSSDLSDSLMPGGPDPSETIGKHFDGLKSARPGASAPETSGVETAGRSPSPDLPLHADPSLTRRTNSLPDTVEFNGLRLPKAHFSEDGPGWLSSRLIAAIDATRETLDLALLEVMHRDLVEAVVRARDRGVRVRIVMDSMHVYPEKPGQHRSPEVQRLIDEDLDLVMVRGGDRYGLMHNKFALMDGRLLWSGSANWSRAADTVHKENATYTSDALRVAGFQKAWDWMHGLGTPFGSPPGKADGQAPPQDPDRPVRFHGTGLPSYAFSPGDDAESWLLKAIGLAGKSLDIAMFSCTSSRIKEALLDAKARGVRIRLVFDKAQFRYLPPMMWFVDNGFDVLLSEGYRPGRSAMHHKFVVFDDRLVQNGSYNWTDGARFNNFENIQFFDEDVMVAEYLRAYERLRRESRPISDDDLDANRAAAAEREREDREHDQRQGTPPTPAVKKGGLTRAFGTPWEGRRFRLSPFRRASLV